MARAKPLQPQDGPMVWIDCEMTGLDFKRDTIIEIAVVITDGNLEPVDDGIEFVIRTDKEVLDNMNEWCVKQHGQSGLVQACLESPHTKENVKDNILEYVQKWVPVQRTAVLAGNSVHADKAFLVNEMPDLIDWLHYRIVDVSSIKELSWRWYPTYKPPRRAPSNHRALDDIRDSIQELKEYRKSLFVEKVEVESEEQSADEPIHVS
ncbi:ribonuclease H-like domain-containing protein [Flagelloscypha sp. PMI_526]|nr:ribonuclease H-like domain-containing protein [Flagelloscypha sp. PMI_526]